MICKGLNVRLKSLIEGPFNLGGLEAKPIMMVTNEAHAMKAFLGLGPVIIILRSRIELGKVHDHSLFVHPSCMFNVYMWYVC